MRGYFESSDGVNQREFKRYISSLNIEENFSEISGISYSSQLDSHQISPFFHKQSGDRAQVLYIEPENDKNTSLL
jgi:CHASE1-domain containing sensor protein